MLQIGVKYQLLSSQKSKLSRNSSPRTVGIQRNRHRRAKLKPYADRTPLFLKIARIRDVGGYGLCDETMENQIILATYIHIASIPKFPSCSRIFMTANIPKCPC